MSGWSWGLLAVLAVGAAGAVAVTAVRSRRPIRTLLTTFGQGLCAVVAVNIFGTVSGISLGFGWLTMTVCAVLGLPGVVGLVLAGLVFG